MRSNCPTHRKSGCFPLEACLAEKTLLEVPHEKRIGKSGNSGRSNRELTIEQRSKWWYEPTQQKLIVLVDDNDTNKVSFQR